MKHTVDFKYNPHRKVCYRRKISHSKLKIYDCFLELIVNKEHSNNLDENSNPIDDNGSEKPNRSSSSPDEQETNHQRQTIIPTIHTDAISNHNYKEEEEEVEQENSQYSKKFITDLILILYFRSIKR